MAVIVGVVEGEGEMGGIGVFGADDVGFPCLALLISVLRGLGGRWGCADCSSINGGGPPFFPSPATPTLPLARTI